MVYRGRFDHGVVVLEGDARPPEGAIVDVVVVQSETSVNAADNIYRLDELATPSGIADLALNLDHYLYGHPKVDDARS